MGAVKISTTSRLLEGAHKPTSSVCWTIKVTSWLVCAVILGSDFQSEFVHLLYPLKCSHLRTQTSPHSFHWSQVSPVLGTGLLRKAPSREGLLTDQTITIALIAKEAQCSSRKPLPRNALRTFKTASSIKNTKKS